MSWELSSASSPSTTSSVGIATMQRVERIEANGWRSQYMRIDQVHSPAVCFMAWATGAPRGISLIKKMTPPRSQQHRSHELADHASKMFWVGRRTIDGFSWPVNPQQAAAYGWTGVYDAAAQASGVAGRHGRASAQAQYQASMRGAQPPPPPAPQRT